MSIISSIFGRYKQALDSSQQRYENIYRENAEHAYRFYGDFLNSLIVSFSESFADPALRDSLAFDMESFFSRREIDFVAVDGTCSKDPFQDFVVFFGGAYGVKGRIALEGGTNKVQYKRWSMDQDVSIVAYVPVPYAEVGDALSDEEDFALSETDKIDPSNVHTRLMQLSEVYLALQLAKSSTIDHPRLILMDLSLSSVLMSTEAGMDRIGIVSENGAVDCLTRADLAIAYSHPVSTRLQIPSAKQYRRYSHLVGRFHTSGQRRISLAELAKDTGVSTSEWETSLGFNTSNPHLAHLLFERTGDDVESIVDVRESWQKSVGFFEKVCSRMFQGRGTDSSDALLYRVSNGDGDRFRWMSPHDISFLIAVGLRALIEECWERDIALVGIAKDSSSRYFSRHYYGTMRHEGLYPKISVSTLPWTDRTLLESVAFQVEELEAPWSTIEFDSCFMTLHLVRDDEGNEHVAGMRGDIVNQERLFARSLAQFYLRRDKPAPLAGHVIFIDRLLHPGWDASKEIGPIEAGRLGTIRPFGVTDKTSANVGHRVTMLLLDILCRNLFPEVIGYPDPLHKADWGAKSMGRRVAQLINSSEIRFKSRPLSRLFRTTRDSARRS